MSSRRNLASAAGTAVIRFSSCYRQRLPSQPRCTARIRLKPAPQILSRSLAIHGQLARDLAAERAQFDKMMAALEQAAADNPTDAAAYQLIATHYWEKAYKDAALSPADKLTYIDAGITATDRALAQKPDYVEALAYKNLLLRLKANMETDPVRRQAWIAEADALRNQAMELSKARAGGDANYPTSAAGPPPPPPPDGNGLQPIRVGGTIKTPTKTHDVRPVYPQEALDARASGVVILEAVIDEQGNVRSARVLRSIPMFDQAAIDAVKGWRFMPTLLNGSTGPRHHDGDGELRVAIDAAARAARI